MPPPPPLFATFFEKDLRGRLHVRPLVFFWGSFPTMSVLEVFGCLERCDSLLFEPRRRSVAQGLLATARGSKFLAFRSLRGSALQNGLFAFSFRSWCTLAVWMFEAPKLNMNMYTWGETRPLSAYTSRIANVLGNRRSSCKKAWSVSCSGARAKESRRKMVLLKKR